MSKDIGSQIIGIGQGLTAINLNDRLREKNGDLLQAQTELALAKLRAETDAIKYDLSDDYDALERENKSNKKMIWALKKDYENVSNALKEKENALKEKDLLILEWMHSEESFRRLAKELGKEIGLSKDDLDSRRSEIALDVADENPKFADTEVRSKAEDRAKIKRASSKF